MEDVCGVSPVKFHLEITLEDDDNVRVKSFNPGAISPWFIVGLLEKIKTSILLAQEED